MSLQDNNIFDTQANILDSIAHLDTETLKNTLAYLLKVYVIDKEVTYDGLVTDDRILDTAPAAATGENREQTAAPAESVRSFLELVEMLKKKYHFPELNLFEINDNRVYIELDGRKHLIPVQTNSMSPMSARSGPNSARSNPLDKPKNENKEPNKPAGQSPDRFKNLELDG